VRLDVPAGVALTDIADRLHRARIIQHPFVFKRYATLAHFDRQIRAGEYEGLALELAAWDEERARAHSEGHLRQRIEW
jgi:cell division protein YceG involved in septum cleavage